MGDITIMSLVWGKGIHYILVFPTDEELKQKKGQAFSAMSTDGIVFSFYHRLPQ